MARPGSCRMGLRSRPSNGASGMRRNGFDVTRMKRMKATAIVLVILVAGVQLIPKEYGEAADVFGATSWQRFTRVTLPLLRPSIQTALILRTVLAFEMFAIVLSIGGRN